jgi:hypothetical protein
MLVELFYRGGLGQAVIGYRPVRLIAIGIFV